MFPPRNSKKPKKKHKAVYKNTARKLKNTTSAIVTSLWPRSDPPVKIGAVALGRGEEVSALAVEL